MKDLPLVEQMAFRGQVNDVNLFIVLHILQTFTELNVVNLCLKIYMQKHLTLYWAIYLITN